jgi:hypothetical protein
LLQPKQQEWRRSEIWVSFFDKHSSNQMSFVSLRDISSFLSCSNFSFRIREKKLYKKYLFNVKWGENAFETAFFPLKQKMSS